jgi:hypothetical protein
LIGHTAVLEMLQTLAKKEKKNRKRREQRKRAQSRRSTAAGQPDRELDEAPAVGLHGAAELAQPEATAAQAGQAERGTLEIPMGDLRMYGCDHMCGFKGHHDSKASMLKLQPMSLVAGTGRKPLAAAKINRRFVGTVFFQRRNTQ